MAMDCMCSHIYNSLKYTCNMNALFSFDLFMVYKSECKQQLRII